MLAKLQKPSYMRDEARTILRNAILEGELQPGERLIEEEIAERIGTSRTPVREALRKLELEGLICQSKLKGMVVVGVSGEDAIEIYGIREVLDGLAARWASQNLVEEDVMVMEDLVRLMADEIERKAMENLFTLHARFHQCLINAARSPRLSQLALPLRDYVEKYFRIAYADNSHLAHFISDHQEIIDALKSGEGDKAEQVARNHVAHSRQVVLDELSKSKAKAHPSPLSENASL